MYINLKRCSTMISIVLIIALIVCLSFLIGCTSNDDEYLGLGLEEMPDISTYFMFSDDDDTDNDNTVVTSKFEESGDSDAGYVESELTVFIDPDVITENVLDDYVAEYRGFVVSPQGGDDVFRVWFAGNLGEEELLEIAAELQQLDGVEYADLNRLVGWEYTEDD